MELHGYPKIYAIGHRAVQDLFLDPVLVEEKVDGSQFSFCRQGDNLIMKSRGSTVFSGGEKMFNKAAETVEKLKDSLTPDWVYRGEYLQKPKQNCLTYSRIPSQHIILFDINTGNEVYLSREQKEQEAVRLGLEIVPKLYEGIVSNPEDIYKLLETESVLGGVKIEGVVVKNYNRFGVDGKALMGKFVSESFKESHGKEWKASNPTLGDVVERIIATLRTERRWEKAAERLRDEGTLEHSPKDIGSLIREVQKDTKEEELEFIKDKLAEYAIPRILRAVSAGLPEWWKERLLKSAFKE